MAATAIVHGACRIHGKCSTRPLLSMNYAYSRTTYVCVCVLCARRRSTIGDGVPYDVQVHFICAIFFVNFELSVLSVGSVGTEYYTGLPPRQIKSFVACKM